MIVFDCPACKSKLQVADEHAGKTMRCPSCQGTAPIPSAQATAVTAEPKPAPPAEPVEATDDMVTAEPPRRREPKNAEEDDRPRRRQPREDDREPVPAKSIALAVILPIVIVGVLGVCCVVGLILVALLVPAVQKVREAAARTQSTNNLKQIALGYHSYHDAFRRLPFNGSDEQIHKKNAIAGDASSGSWGFQILPFIEQQPVQAALDRNAPIKTFMCPGRGRPMLEINGGAWTDYFYNNYLNDPDHASRPDNRDMQRTLVGITDGTSNTILVGHGNIPIDLYPAAGGVPFSTNIFNGGTVGTMRSGGDAKLGGNPAGVSLQRDSAGMATNVGSWGGPFPQGGLMAMADGTVRLFPYSMGNNFAPFLTPAGGEVVVLPDT